MCRSEKAKEELGYVVQSDSIYLVSTLIPIAIFQETKAMNTKKSNKTKKKSQST